jgi:hypothetical protein
MSNERANEFLSWRAKLNGTDALPGQGLDDKEESWQRLAERLRKQPRRVGIAWWIAAASLILAFFLPATHLFRTRPAHHDRVALRPSTLRPSTLRQPAPPALRPSTLRQPVTPAQSRPLTPTQARSVTPAQAQPLTPAGKTIRPAPSKYGEIAAISHPVRYHIPALVQTAVPDIAVTDAQSAAPSAAPPTAPAIAPNAAPNLAAAPPSGATPLSRRPLRITYLNELGKDPGPAAEPSFRRPAFLRLGTAGDWTTTATNTSTIKIDLFPHNH